MLEAINAIANLCKRYNFFVPPNEEMSIEAFVTLHPHKPLLIEATHA